jgi:hypothetical protein
LVGIFAGFCRLGEPYPQSYWPDSMTFRVPSRWI